MAGGDSACISAFSILVYVVLITASLAEDNNHSNMQQQSSPPLNYSYLSLSVHSFQIYSKLLLDLMKPAVSPTAHTVQKRETGLLQQSNTNDTDTTIALLSNATDYTLLPADNSTSVTITTTADSSTANTTTDVTITATTTLSTSTTTTSTPLNNDIELNQDDGEDIQVKDKALEEVEEAEQVETTKPNYSSKTTEFSNETPLVSSTADPEMIDKTTVAPTTTPTAVTMTTLPLTSSTANTSTTNVMTVVTSAANSMTSSLDETSSSTTTTPPPSVPTSTSTMTPTPSSTDPTSSSQSASSQTTTVTSAADDVQEDRMYDRYDGQLREQANDSKGWWMEDKCETLTQAQLVDQLKSKGTYNPDLMAWDVPGVIRFLEKTTVDTYDVDEDDLKKTENADKAVENNLLALERILNQLNVPCDVRSPEVVERMKNLTAKSKKDLINFRRAKRQSEDPKSGFDYYYARNKYLRNLYEYHTSLSHDQVAQTIVVDNEQSVPGDEPVSTTAAPDPASVHGSSTTTLKPDNQQTTRRPPAETHEDPVSNAHAEPAPDPESHIDGVHADNIIGTVHVVPFGCQKRGSREEGGYLRLCGVCQAIRRLPDNFFPPFINEVLCDQDKACLYFYDYPHGKCKQKHMNFVVLKNIGTPECQIWRKFNINVRVCCECFVDEMSFFSKYV